jgi:protein tyrosine phosphatase (PTP) superfamily phosphohydrolase (DUF442 family)
MNASADLCAIRAFLAISDKLGTAGQPTAEQLRSVKEAGFEAVINLALPTSDNAIADEGSLVTKLGMAYVHIPVNFQAPRPQDFRDFTKMMGAFANRPVFVHCAANMRVSAFVFLYRVLHQNVPAAEAKKDLDAIWEPDEVWKRFIETELETTNKR